MYGSIFLSVGSWVIMLFFMEKYSFVEKSSPKFDKFYEKDIFHEIKSYITRNVSQQFF